MAVCYLFLIDSAPVAYRICSVVLAGTNGEAVTLSLKEKSDLVSTTRRLANDLGRPDITIKAQEMSLQRLDSPRKLVPTLRLCSYQVTSTLL